MRLKLSNTGKNITITFADDVAKTFAQGANYRVKPILHKDGKTITIQAHPRGWKISESKGHLLLSFPADKFSKWPTHDKVWLTTVSATSESLVLALPEGILPVAKPRQSGKRMATIRENTNRLPRDTEEAAPVVQPKKGNLLFAVGTKHYAFHLPENDLLDLACELAHKGYQV